MTPEHIALVKSSFAQVEPLGTRLGLAFYHELFDLDPDLRHLFPPDLEAQAAQFVAALALAVRSLDDLGPLMERLRTLGRRHGACGVEPEDFHTARCALLATLHAALGEALTPAVRDAWKAAYHKLSRVMIEAMSEQRGPLCMAV